MDKKEKIEIIRNIIFENKYPLEFDRNYTSYYNCYAYAIGSTFKDDKDSKDNLYNLGYISNIVYPPNTIEEADKAFKSDMNVLNIKCRNSTYVEQLQKDEWKVILFFDNWKVEEVERIMTQYKDDEQKEIIRNYLLNAGHDFHIIRQDRDESWSHKLGKLGHISRFIGNPESESELDIVGYYILKKF